MVTILNMGISDVLDIAMVALFFYTIFSLLRETRSFVALLGFITVMIASLLLFLISQFFQLQAMTLLFRNFWVIVVLIFLIAFQNEFKKALTDIGKLRFFRSLFSSR